MSWGVYTLQHQDVLYVRWNGAGGIGDPMRRDAAAVARDVREGVVSAAAAQAIYGVALRGDGSVDEEATRAWRGVRGPREGAGGLLLPRTCRACGYHERANRGETGFEVLERNMRELGPVYTTGPETLLRELICPACGAQTDAQVARKGDGLLMDRVAERGGQKRGEMNEEGK